MSKKTERLSQRSSEKLDQRSNREKVTKDDATKKTSEETLKKGPYTISTPRSYIAKSSTADIYGRSKLGSSTKAPKKAAGSHFTSSQSNVSPMKDVLKSSSSNTSLLSSSREKSKTSAKKMETPKTKDFNVTVNSPIAIRKLNLEVKKEKSFIKDQPKRPDSSQKTQRPRTKTRTLAEDEVKVLTVEPVDNNLEMKNLTKRLAAKPKAFYVELEENKKAKKEKPQKVIKEPSDDEVSYEDDFESYESDFESDHSSSPGEENDDGEDDENDNSVDVGDKVIKDENKDEENMLDSGNFDLRDQKSANKVKPAVMDFIQETSEDLEEKKISLTDEGFQEMSSSSGLSSMKTVDVLDRHLFLNFNKSNENRRKKKINERLKQRAKDLLSIITLHEMSYSLFEMKPISYDLYMATFGRANYTQVAIQTFEDGVSEEVQTDEIECHQKWTQFPVNFSNSEICFSNRIETRKYSKNTEDYLTKFTFLTKRLSFVDHNNVINLDEDYKSNQLRIYLEQKDGVGSNQMLPYETYKAKLKTNSYDTNRLGKFVKRMESRISHILNMNNGNFDSTDLVKSSKFPFSKGFITISTKNLTDNKLPLLKNTKVTLVCVSKNEYNLLLTVHKLTDAKRSCLVCLWDIGVARNDPVKVLTAIDNVIIGRLKGAADGFFVAALEDGSISLWDLSEEPLVIDDVASIQNPTNLIETQAKEESNKNNESDKKLPSCTLLASAYTTSAHNMAKDALLDRIVGLALTDASVTQDGGRKVFGQVISLQRTGILIIWSIIQEKAKAIPPDIGRAYWSKTKLERNQTISVLDYIDIPMTMHSLDLNFNLNAAKKRLCSKKREKNMLKKHYSRPKSAISSDFDIDRPNSAAKTKVLPLEKNVSEKWESGLVCFDLKIMRWKNVDSYLIAKNSGEVLCVKKILGAIKVERFLVASDLSSVTCLEVSPHRLPYYLAATDSGTVNLCSLLDNRVLLTLDCRNAFTQEPEKCHSDSKGRYVSSVSVRQIKSFDDSRVGAKQPVTSLSWSPVNPCHLLVSVDGGAMGWDLTRSDIYAESVNENVVMCVTSGNAMVILTSGGEVQIHRLNNEKKTKEYLQIFEKYVALL